MPKSFYLLRFNELFLPYLKNYFVQRRKELRNNSSIIKEAGKQIESLTLSGGKRIRPALLYYSFHGFSGGSLSSIKNYCLSLELLHSWALIHDDIMDRGIIRRGKKSTLAYFQEKYPNSHLGSSLALQTGNLALSFADNLFTQTPIKDDHLYSKLFSLYSDLKNEVIYGQFLDILKPSSESEVFHMMQFKTAGYTIEKPLLIGAILGKASEKQLALLSHFGKSLGLAFQIQDDILGTFGNDDKLGKSRLSDLQEGKMNLLALKTLEMLNSSAKKTFLKHWGNPKSGYKELAIIQDLMRTSTACSYCFSVFNNLKTASLNKLNQHVLPSPLSQILKELVSEILPLTSRVTN